jgi:transcriptional antiterminator NusG
MNEVETVSDSEDPATGLQSPKFSWYALQVFSNCEARAKRALYSGAKLANVEHLIGRVLSPVENVCEVRNGKKIVRQRKLYSGYLFVELALHDEHGEINHALWQLVRSVQGVSKFVGSDKPVALSRSEVDEILARAELGEKRTTVSKYFYEIGTLVKITDGPFAGSSGEVESLDEEAGTLRVAVGLFGRKTPVDLEFWQIKKEDV